jgi:copper transport protein
MRGDVAIRGSRALTTWRGRVWLPLVLLMLMAPEAGLAHLRLRASAPRDSAELASVPREIRLSFTQPVQLAFTRIELLDPSGRPVELGPLATLPDSAGVVVAEIRGTFVVPGAYTVSWQAAGPDGHPISGRFTFVVQPGAAGLATAEPESPAPAEAVAPPAPASERRSIDAGSPIYAAIRWLTFAGLLGVVGATAFRLLVLGGVERERTAFGAALVESAGGRAAGLAMVMAVVLLVSALLRLYAQSSALGGAEAGRIGAILTGTTWGVGWLLQTIGSLVAFAGALAVRRRPGLGWGLVAIAALALAFSPAFSGHAAAAPRLPALAVLADALHVLGAGGWLGTLLVLVVVGLPAALSLPSGERGAAVAAVVNAFSPAALFFAGVAAATGTFAAWLHLGGASALWGSAYGRTLLLKLAVLAVVFAAGAYHWLRVKPALGNEESARRLRRSAAFEVAAAAIVLAVTAVLVATPPPAEGLDAAAAHHDHAAVAGPEGQ